MKKIRLGLSGVEDTLSVLAEVAMEFNQFECIPLIHQTEDELIEQMKAYNHSIDIWLFSGKLIYQLKDKIPINKPCFYVPYTGSSLYRTLYSTLKDKNLMVEQLSFDIFDIQELKQVFEELGVNSEDILLCKETKSIETIVNYHEKLWSDGKSSAAVTCIWSVKEALEKRGVPVYRVIPTKSSVRTTIFTALQTLEMLRFKDMQTAVQFIEINMENRIQKDYFSPYELHHQEMKAFHKLLEYAMQLQGSLKSMGSGRFAVFTTRGILEEITNNFKEIPNFPSAQFLISEKATTGIGIGLTTYNAEMLAGKALAHAKNFKSSSWFAMLEDGKVIGPIGEEEQVVTEQISPHIEQIAVETGLSTVTLSRVERTIRTYGMREFSANELAEYMQIIPRSARRILIALENKKYATCIGYEKISDRGRPRKKYRLEI